MSKANWFYTWRVPEYIELAKKCKNGYFLLIARKEKGRWLLAQAKLIFKSSGLPQFKLIQYQYAKTEKEKVTLWRKWKKLLDNLN